MERARNIVKWMQKEFLKNREANLFLVFVLCAGIAMACINPPFQECDGWFHYLFAMDVSHGNLLNPLVDLSGHESGMVTVPENLDEYDYRIIQPGSGEGGELI